MVLDALSYVSSSELEAMYDYKINPLGQVAYPVRFSFCIDPSVKSSLRFLRTTPWAREKVESLYLYVLRQKAKQKP